MQIKGPGDVLSLTSFWVREHCVTAVSLTHVKAIILDERSLSLCLESYPRVLRSWTHSYVILKPIFESCLNESGELFQRKEEHDALVEATIDKARARWVGQKKRGIAVIQDTLITGQKYATIL